MTVKEVVEYRHRPGDLTWLRSESDWTAEQVLRMNKIVGYEKYRVRFVNN